MPAIAVLDPVTGVVIRASKGKQHRYERPAPSDLVHVDVKELGRIPDGGGHRLHGRRTRPGGERRIGFAYVHAAVDDHSRLSYAEIHPDAKGTTCAEILPRAAEFFHEHGITVSEVMTDNAKNYTKSREFQDVLVGLSAQHVLIRPYCPWQNGKVERFNLTLQAEWAYRQPFITNTQRAEALEPWLDHYNYERNHHDIGGQPPISRVTS